MPTILTGHDKLEDGTCVDMVRKATLREMIVPALLALVAVIVVAVFSLFFFQAEDGIRDLTVTGVQTCALPICTQADIRDQVEGESESQGRDDDEAQFHATEAIRARGVGLGSHETAHPSRQRRRSEERRVGKECRSRWSPYH